MPNANEIAALKTIWFDDARTDTKLSWPVKMFVEFTNKTQGEFEVSAIDFVTSINNAHVHVHPFNGVGRKLRVWRKPNGMKTDAWDESDTAVKVPKGDPFRLWIGMSLGHTVAKLNEMKNSKKLGKLSFNVKIGGNTQRLEYSI